MNDPETIRRLLTEAPVWAVVGLRDNPLRTAYRIAQLLQGLGRRVVPVHPAAETVHGERGYATLADIPFPVDVVDVFRRSAVAGETADEAIATGAKAVWFQLGVIDDAAAARVEAAGLHMVMNTCPAVEAPRLGLI